MTHGPLVLRLSRRSPGPPERGAGCFFSAELLESRQLLSVGASSISRLCSRRRPMSPHSSVRRWHRRVTTFGSSASAVNPASQVQFIFGASPVVFNVLGRARNHRDHLHLRRASSSAGIAAFRPHPDARDRGIRRAARSLANGGASTSITSITPPAMTSSRAPGAANPAPIIIVVAPQPLVLANLGVEHGPR